jgi:HKD family nuclease
MIVEKLNVNLSPLLKSANEIWVAVALLSRDGVKYLLGSLPKNCIQHYIIGVDLPTEPTAMQELLNRKAINNKIDIEIYSNKKMAFHSKVYIVKSSTNVTTIIGSANCTNGGLYNNEELSFVTIDTEIYNHTVDWFKKITTDEKTKPLTQAFINDYSKEFDERQKNSKGQKKCGVSAKNLLEESHLELLKNQASFISMLEKYRKDVTRYETIKESRSNDIVELRAALDYPNFKKIDLEVFFHLPELGSVSSYLWDKIREDRSKLPKLFKMLCDETIPLNERYDKALTKYKVDGVAEGIVSKILCIHRPDLYYVGNNKTTDLIKNYGLDLPRGLSKGEKYFLMCEYMRKICKETNITDLSVLDSCIWLEAKNKSKK